MMATRIKLIAALTAVVAVLNAGAARAAEFVADIVATGHVALTSDYVFRGISFSDENPAVQGGAQVSHGSGAYIGTFLSTVDKPFNASYNEVGGEEELEIDLFVGWRQQFGPFKDYGVDVGVINYGFQRNPDDIDWAEIYVAGNWRWFSARFHTQISGMEMGNYYQGAFRYTFADRYTVRVFAGLFDLDRELRFTDQYVHYGAAVSTEFHGVNFELAFHDTNDDGEQRYLNAAEERLVLTISKNFDIIR